MYMGNRKAILQPPSLHHRCKETTFCHQCNGSVSGSPPTFLTDRNIQFQNSFIITDSDALARAHTNCSKNLQHASNEH